MIAMIFMILPDEGSKFLQIFITTFSAGIPLTPEGGTIA